MFKRHRLSLLDCLSIVSSLNDQLVCCPVRRNILVERIDENQSDTVAWTTIDIDR